MTDCLTRAFPHVLVAAACMGLAAANAARATSAFVALVAATLGVGAAVRTGGLRIALLAAALAVGGWWWASARLDALDRSALVREAGRSARVTAVVTGPARRGLFDLRVPADLHRFGRLRVDEAALLLLPRGRAPPQGARIELIGRIELPRTGESGFDERGWLRRRGAHVVVRGERWYRVGRRGGLAGAGDRLHEHLARALARGADGERRAVLTGVLLGEDEGLSDDLRQSFRASGLYHLLAVSGQNVAFLAGGLLLLAWLAGMPRWMGELGALGAIGAYVLAVGWQPSVVRAGVAGCLASLAWLAARPRDRWYFLLLGAAVLLAWNPYSLLEPGFQLSFAAVAAIFVAVPRIRRLLAGYPVPRVVADVVSVSLACGAATAPIVWLHFGAIPAYSVLANALAAPVVGPLLALGLAAAAVDPIVPPVAASLAWAAGWLAAYLAWCARLVAALPHAELTSGRAVLVLALLAGTAALVTRLRGAERRSLLAVLAAASVLAVAWRVTAEPALPPAAGLRLTFLDVGQGDSTLIEAPGAAVLVDAGPPEADVAAELRRLGVRRVDLLVMTHPSRDNIGGAEDVVRSVDVGAVLDPQLPFDNPYGAAALAAARRRDVPIVAARAGRTYRLGRLTLRVLWPDGDASPGDDPNDHATVLLVSYGAVDALLPADAESNVTLRLRPPPVEILKVGHHGSADSGLPQLLRLVRPRIAVISVGARNEYGHPAPSTAAALAAAPGLTVYRTDRHGRVTIESDGERLEVRHSR